MRPSATSLNVSEGGRCKRRGFALLITIVLLAFLVLLLVSLATLTQVETQVAANTQRVSQARQNALMALNLALGELQRSTGADRRVTAPSNVGPSASGTSDEQPFLTGVWRHDPGSANDLPTLAYAPKLVSWLVSGNENMVEGEPLVTPGDVAALPLPDSANDVVWLLGEKSVEFSGTASATNPDPRVRLRKQPIQAAAGMVPGLDATETPTIGHYAWWVGDEGVKARINLRDPFYSSAAAHEQKARLASVQRIRGGSISGFGPTAFPEDSTATTRVVRAEQLSLLAPEVVSSEWRKNHHNVTVVSEGLLTDTLNGGLRQDFSYLASRPAVADFRVSLNLAFADLTASFNAGAKTSNLIAAPGVSVAPWLPGFFTVDGKEVGPTWEQLYSFARLPTEVDATGGVAPRTQTENRHGVGPVLVQAKLAFGLRAVSSAIPGRFNIYVHYFPLFVLGNPHSVALRPSSYHVNFRANENVLLRVGSTDRAVLSMEGFANTTFKLETTEPIPAGEARVFSLEFEEPALDWEVSPPSYRFTDGGTYKMVADFSPDVSVRQLVTDSGGAPVDFTEAEKNSARVGISGRPRMGAFLWNEAPSDNTTIYQILGSEVADDTEVATDVTGTLGSDANIFPGGGFMQRHMEPSDGYLSLGYFGEVNSRAPVLKGSVNTSGSSLASAGYPIYRLGHILRASRQYFDGRPGKLTIRADNRTVPWLFNSISGAVPLLDSLPVFQVPSEQLNSLAQLQHFNATGFLPAGDVAQGGFPGVYGATPPYPSASGPTNSFALQIPYAVGNSRASMFIPRDELSRDPPASNGGHYRDTSYLLNTALWDRFYFSSVDYASGAAVDFGSPQVAAVNRRYVPIGSGSTAVVAENDITPATGAEHLKILGALNVNSTSVEVWKAFLGGLQGVAFNDDVGASEAAFPRHLDLRDKTSGSAGGITQNAWSGFRKLNSAQLTTLAEKIVDQVKLRGPFLSLSGFVNRRIISSGADTALIGTRGAIDAAIMDAGFNAVAQTPYADAPPTSTASTADAAHRQSHQITDFPGWLTQADILQPLAPYLTARSDTFTIRTYGDVHNPVTNAIEGRAWCEAVVQRRISFVDSSQSISTSVPNLNPTNELFGRRFEVVSFRWLGLEDI